ncbi:MAG: NAD(P)-dependent oxidoreductase [Thermoleophilia bacterium]|nr:NAD(P)-dependent oxidoreductase [Thermoleophilia bacterium]
MSARPTYGFVGLGKMGGPMAANLARSGADIVVFDSAGSAVRALAEARVASSVAEVAAASETVFFSLPDGPVVLEVLGEVVAAADRVTRTVIDLSTVGIDAARAAYARASDGGIVYVDAPVSGGRNGAVAGTITVMWAGPGELLESHGVALEAMSKNVFHVGTQAGQGQALKLLNNFLSATATAATAEALLFGLTQGLELKTMLDVVNVSTGRSHASADKYVNRVLTGTFDSGFATSLMAKDVRLFAEAAAAAGSPNELGATVRALWDAMDAHAPAGDHTEVFTFLRDHGGH